jgi:hypothetical protein
MKKIIFVCLLLSGCTYRPYTESQSNEVPQDRFSNQVSAINDALQEFEQRPSADHLTVRIPKKESEQFFVYFSNEGYSVKENNGFLVFDFTDKYKIYKNQQEDLKAQQDQSQQNWESFKQKLQNFWSSYKWIMLMAFCLFSFLQALLNPSEFDKFFMLMFKDSLQKFKKEKEEVKKLFSGKP